MNIFSKSRKFLHLVLTFVAMLTSGGILSAQLCLGYEIREDADNTKEIYLDVISEQFNDVAAIQLTLSFEPDLYEFKSFVESGLTGFTESSFKHQPADKEGAIAVVWFDATTQGIDYEDDKPLFTLKFIKKSNTSGVFSFIDEPTAIEIVICEPNLGPCKVLYNFEDCITGENLAPALKGQLFLDEDEDCVFDEEETNNTLTNGWAGWFIVSEQDGKYYGSGNHQMDGSYELKLFSGQNKVEILLPSPYYSGCETQFEFDTEDLDLEEVIKNPIQITEFCPFMGIELFAFPITPCEETAYFIKCTNNGTANAENVFIELDLDYRLTDIAFLVEANATDLRNNQFKIEVGELAIGESKSFIIEANVPCEITDAEMLRNEARVFPNEICGTLPDDWSGASLQVNGTCIDKEIVFEVENVGNGDMSEPLEYVVIEDAVIFRTERLQLKKGAKEIVTLNATGASYFMQMQQEKGHPGNYVPSAFVEACGRDVSESISTGFANRFPEENNDYFVDVEYQAIRNTDNSNRIMASPIGYSTEHFIEPQKPIEYTIFFKNYTSNLVITDTLSEDLDISTFKPISANRPHEFTIEDNVLKLTIPASASTGTIDNDGFIKFSLQPKADLAMGTIIVNKATLKFGAEDQEITNTVFHTIMEDFVGNSTSIKTILPDNPKVSVFPNPASESITFSVNNWQSTNYTLNIFNVDGKSIQQTAFNNPTFRFQRGDLPNGTYLYRLVGENGHLENGFFILVD